MKKLLKLFTILFIFLCVNVNAESSCAYSEKHALNTEISHIKIKYEVKQGTFGSDVVSGCDEENCNVSYDYFDVSILNMSENFYVVVTNNYDNNKITLYASDADEEGILHFNHETIMEKVTYTFTFYASTETGCARTKIKSYTKSFPRKNLYAAEGICSDIPDADICQEYVFYDELDYSDFYKVATEEAENATGTTTKKTEVDDRSFLDKAIDFIIDNKYYFIGGAAGVAVVVLVTTFNKRRKQDEKN